MSQSLPPKDNRSIEGSDNQAVQGDNNRVTQVNAGIVNLSPTREESSSEKPTGIPQNIPRSGVVKFVGRDKALKKLHEQLQQNGRIAITAIAGMGGIGKTELALQYARYHWEQGTYPGGVCWLRALRENVGIQIVRFACSQLGLEPQETWDLETQIAYCWRNWREEDSLIVLDDVIDFGALQSYLPPTEPRFLLLLTTRQKLGVSISQLDLDVLSPDAALALLKAIAGDERINLELEGAKELCKWLGYLPLALELTGRYLYQDKTLTVTKVQERLEKKRLEARVLCKRQSDMTGRLGVAAAFELTWERLPVSGRQLGCRLSLFAAAPFEWDLVEACLPESDPEDLEDIRNDFLVSRHLLQLTDGGTCRLHPLIREFLQTKLLSMIEVDEYKRSFCRAMVEVARKIEQTPTRREIEAVSRGMPHVAEVATNLTDWIDDEDLIWPFLGLGRFYEGQGGYEQARPWREQCLSLTRNRFGLEHSDVATSLNNLALLYDSQGKYDLSEPLYLDALEMVKRLLGDRHPYVASSLNNLAALYRSQGEYELAEPLYLDALEMIKQLLGDRHPYVASSLNNLAALYDSQGKYERAEPLYKKALDIAEEMLGANHPNAITIRENLEILRNQK